MKEVSERAAAPTEGDAIFELFKTEYFYYLYVIVE